MLQVSICLYSNSIKTANANQYIKLYKNLFSPYRLVSTVFIKIHILVFKMCYKKYKNTKVLISNQYTKNLPNPFFTVSEKCGLTLLYALALFGPVSCIHRGKEKYLKSGKFTFSIKIGIIGKMFFSSSK